MKPWNECPGAPPKAITDADRALSGEWEKFADEIGDDFPSEIGRDFADALFPDGEFWDDCAKAADDVATRTDDAFLDKAVTLARLLGAAAIVNHQLACIVANSEGPAIQLMFEAARLRRMNESFTTRRGGQ